MQGFPTLLMLIFICVLTIILKKKGGYIRELGIPIHSNFYLLFFPMRRIENDRSRNTAITRPITMTRPANGAEKTAMFINGITITIPFIIKVRGFSDAFVSRTSMISVVNMKRTTRATRTEFIICAVRKVDSLAHNIAPRARIIPTSRKIHFPIDPGIILKRFCSPELSRSTIILPHFFIIYHC